MLVTLLVDNRADGALLSEHGLSFLVETDKGSVLFDTGQTDAWFRNLVALRKDAASIRAVAVSHGHYDHTGGLTRAFHEKLHAKYHAHPDCFAPRFARSADGNRYIGMPKDVVQRRTMFDINRTATEIMPGVMLSGEVQLVVPAGFDSRHLAGDGELLQDTYEDEQCLVVRKGNSISVLVGCAHRGLENNVRAAMNAEGVDKIDLIAGGFHLGGTSEDSLEALVGFLRSVDVGRIACCHCTGNSAYEYMRSKLGPRVTLGTTGASWAL